MLPPVILMYHRLAEPDCDPWSLAVSPSHFAEHMEVLARNFRPISLSQLTAELAENRFESGSVSITFDDGYANNLLALPILAESGVPATIFVVSGALNAKREFWWDQLEKLLLQPGSLPEILDVHTPDGVRAWQVGSCTAYGDEEFRNHRGWKVPDAAPTARQSLYHSIWEMLHPFREAPIQNMIDQLLEHSGRIASFRDEFRPLTTEELRQLDACDLIEIGAHSRTHPVLPNLQKQEQYEEISGSKADLEKALERPLKTFAYPYGSFDKETIEEVKRSGFHVACSTAARRVHASEDLFALPRLQVNDCGGEHFEKMLREQLVSV